MKLNIYLVFLITNLITVTYQQQQYTNDKNASENTLINQDNLEQIYEILHSENPQISSRNNNANLPKNSRVLRISVPDSFPVEECTNVLTDIQVENKLLLRSKVRQKTKKP